jgi:hypothetical protein
MNILVSEVGIVTGYGTDGRGSIPGRGNIFLFSTASRPAMGPTQPLIQKVPRALFQRAKRSGSEADHSPPFSAEVKNGEALLPPSLCLHSVVLN